MASYRKRAGSWRVEVYKHGVRDSATFDTKAQAVAWATKRELEIESGGAGIEQHTLAEALERYRDAVSPTKRGEKWERLRIGKFLEATDIVGLPVSKVKPAHIAAWRDARLKEVAAPSVRREMTLLQSVFEIARKEWGWVADNPMKEVRKPSDSAPRTRRVSEDEQRRMLAALGYAGGVPETQSQYIALASLFALETAMRAGEICKLTWASVDLPGRFVRLELTKNGDARQVPLSSEAIRILDLLPRTDPVFHVTTGVLDALWRRARDRAGIEGLHFHDTRHEACTRLAKKLDVLDLARMIGHRDLKSLMIYYNPTMHELAARLG